MRETKAKGGQLSDPRPSADTGGRMQPPPATIAPERSKTNSKGEKQCFRCHGWGHVSYNCPKVQQVQVPTAQPKALYGGGCPELSSCKDYVRNGSLDGNPVQMLIDTGCDRTLVSEELVDPSKINRTKTAQVLCIGVGASPVGPVLTGPLFRKKLVGVTIITINTCVLVRAAAACSATWLIVLVRSA